MMPEYLHQQLMQACQNGCVEDAQRCLDTGVDLNFNIKNPTNALSAAIQSDNHQIVNLLLENGAIIKEYVLQKAIEKDKNYLNILVPDLKACKDESLFMGILHAAINVGDLDLVKQAIHQGAKPESLFLFAIKDFGDTKILQLLIENGFNIHGEKNILLSEWMGTCELGDWGRQRRKRDDLMVFICEYYLEKPKSIEKFKSWRLVDKSRLFRMGLLSNNFNMMKFSVLIGADKNEALNSTFHRYYAKDHGNNNLHSKIIEYILNSEIKFKKITILNAVCFKYTELLNALSSMHDLEYAYEIAYTYENDDLCEYFINRGVSKEEQSFIKMKVSAIKGNIKELRKALSDGAKVEMIDTDVIVEIINENQVESLKYLYDAGVVFNTSFNKYLNDAMNEHKAYKTISYLIEQGLDITSVRNMPLVYKKSYPAIADMWKKRFTNIFDYTIYLVEEIHTNENVKKREESLKKIAELSSLPYVIKKSEERSLAH